MSDFRLISERYVLPTPAGAFYAVSGTAQDSARQFIFSLMADEQSKYLSADDLLELTDAETEQDALEMIYRVQTLGWVQGEDTVREAPSGTLEDELPALLRALTGSGKALLADHQGFYLATEGFSHETAEELSALTADLASLHQRHSGLLAKNLAIDSSAWALVDASGNSRLGCWPMNIGGHRFTLVISGVPQFNQWPFVQLAWMLTKRYSVVHKARDVEAGLVL